MIPIPLSWFLFAYVVSGLLLIFGLWLYYDFRDSRALEKSRGRVLFFCVRCNALYERPKGTEVAACSRCGQENIRLQF
ncbi:MAG: hydrogenase nickel incorporation protein HypA [Opitutales bacterium]